MKAKPWLCAVLLACAGGSRADEGVTDGVDPGPYLSAQLGGGRIDGGNASGNRWMRSRAGEFRFGRPQTSLSGTTGARFDVVYYNEGHPDNNHRDGYALQEVVSVRTAGGRLGAELGIGPYLSMNTTFIDGRHLDDTRWGLLLSAALRIALSEGPDSAHLRIGFNHVAMREVHRSNALMLGFGRQFGASAPDPDTAPGIGATWFGISGGAAVTSMPGTGTGRITVFEASRDLNHGPAHWAGSARLLFEGSDGVRVDRRGLAGQLSYVQQVTPRFSMSAGIGPYVARNRRDDNQTRANLLMSLQAERALSDRTRVFFSFDRVKTFLRRDDRDLFLVGVRKRF
jgi:hypothetical protein